MSGKNSFVFHLMVLPLIVFLFSSESFALTKPSSLTLTTDKKSYIYPQNIVLTATPSVASGAIREVRFLNGSALLGVVKKSPYVLIWGKAGVGKHSLSVEAIFTTGATLRAALSVTVAPHEPPKVNLSGLSSKYVLPKAPLVIASATVSTGSIAKVDFFNGKNLLSTSTKSPYTYTLNQPGTYSLTARVTDSTGASATSAAVPVIVVPLSYTLTATTDNNGSIFPAGTTTVSSNASQVFTFTPNNNYQIAGITVDGVSLTPPLPSSYTFSNITANHTINATFTPVTYAVLARPIGNGNVNFICAGSPCSNLVPAGTSVTFTESPNTGNAFSSWGGACSGSASSCTVVINSNTVVSATFVSSLMPNGAPCAGATNCISGFCNSFGLCSDRSIGSSCNAVSDCSSGYCDTSANECTDGTLGAGCGADSQCQSGTCNLSDNACVASIPQTDTVTINSGAAATSSNVVTLSLTAFDSGSPMGPDGNMQFSNDNVNWSTPVPFSSTQSWQLADGNGPKTVYAMFQDSESNWSSVVSANIFAGDPTLIANYLFNGDYTDNSGYGNDGQGHGGLRFMSLPSGRYYAEFNGTDSYITVPSASLLNLNANTVSFWIKPNYNNYANQTYTILSKGTGANTEYSLQITGGPQGFSVSPLSGQASSNLTTAQAANVVKNNLMVKSSTMGMPIVAMPTLSGLSAPTNLVIQDGGVSSSTGQRILYLSWQDNSGSNGQGYGLIIDNGMINPPPVILLQAGSTSYKAYLNPTDTTETISVYASNPGTVNSQSAVAKVNLSTSPITVTPQYTTPNGFLPLDNNWHHVVRSWDQSGLTKYYIDGQLIYRGQMLMGPQGQDPLVIGASNPNLVVPIQSTLSTDGATMTVSWASVAGDNYQVQYSADGHTWNNLGAVISGTEGASSVTDPNYQSGNVYQVLQLAGQIFNGGLSNLSFYNRLLSDPEVGQLYQSQWTANFMQINVDYANAAEFATLPQPQYSQAMNDLQALSQKYASAFSSVFPDYNNPDEYASFIQQIFNARQQFYTDQLTLLDKYGILASYNTTLSQAAAFYQSLWQSQQQSQFGASLNTPTPSSSAMLVKSHALMTPVNPVSTDNILKITATPQDVVAALKQINVKKLISNPKELLNILPSSTSKIASGTSNQINTRPVLTVNVRKALTIKPLDQAASANSGATNSPPPLVCAWGPVNIRSFSGPSIPIPPYTNDSHVPSFLVGTVSSSYYTQDANGNCTNSPVPVLWFKGISNQTITNISEPGLQCGGTDLSTNIYSTGYETDATWDLYDMFGANDNHNTRVNLKNQRDPDAPYSIPVYSNVEVITNTLPSGQPGSVTYDNAINWGSSNYQNPAIWPNSCIDFSKKSANLTEIVDQVTDQLPMPDVVKSCAMGTVSAYSAVCSEYQLGAFSFQAAPFKKSVIIGLGHNDAVKCTMGYTSDIYGNCPFGQNKYSKKQAGFQIGISIGGGGWSN